MSQHLLKFRHLTTPRSSTLISSATYLLGPLLLGPLLLGPLLVTSLISSAQALPTTASTLTESSSEPNGCTDANIEALSQRWNEGYLPAGPALKACGDRALPALAAAMTNTTATTTAETIRRGISARLVGQIGSPKALDILLTALQDDTVAIVGLQAIHRKASKAQSPATTDFLQAALTSNTPTTRIGAAYALAKINTPENDDTGYETGHNETVTTAHNSAVSKLVQVMNDDTAPLTHRELSARFMGSLGTTEAVNQLMKGVEQNNPVALASLSNLKATPEAIAQISQTLSHDAQTVRIGAAYALAAMGSKAETAIPELATSLARKLFDPSEEDFRAMALYTLAEINSLHPDALGALGSVTAQHLFGYDTGRFEASLQVRAVATEALEKIDRQANVRSLLTHLTDENATLFATAWGAEFVLTAPMDDALEATVYEYLSEASTPTELRQGAAKLIQIKRFDEDNFVANNFAKIAALLVAIVEDDAADLKLRQQAAISLTESLFAIEGTARTMQPFIPQLAASFEQAEDPATLYEIANVLGAIYVKSAYPANTANSFHSHGEDAFNTDRVAAIESALIGIVSRSTFYSRHWQQATASPSPDETAPPGPYEMAAFRESAAGLSFGLLKSVNTQPGCTETQDFCPITDALTAFITPLKTLKPETFRIWMLYAQAPAGTPDMMTADNGYSLDRSSASRLAASIEDETGITQPTRPAICHLAIAPQMIPECR